MNTDQSNQTKDNKKMSVFLQSMICTLTHSLLIVHEKEAEKYYDSTLKLLEKPYSVSNSDG